MLLKVKVKVKLSGIKVTRTDCLEVCDFGRWLMSITSMLLTMSIKNWEQRLIPKSYSFVEPALYTLRTSASYVAYWAARILIFVRLGYLHVQCNTHKTIKLTSSTKTISDTVVIVLTFGTCPTKELEWLQLASICANYLSWEIDN